jgi:hypothetical protein
MVPPELAEPLSLSNTPVAMSAFAWRKAGLCIGGADGSEGTPKRPDSMGLSLSNIAVAPSVPQAAGERPAESVSLNRVRPAAERE